MGQLGGKMVTKRDRTVSTHLQFSFMSYLRIVQSRFVSETLLSTLMSTLNEAQHLSSALKSQCSLHRPRPCLFQSVFRLCTRCLIHNCRPRRQPMTRFNVYYIRNPRGWKWSQIRFYLEAHVELKGIHTHAMTDGKFLLWVRSLATGVGEAVVRPHMRCISERMSDCVSDSLSLSLTTALSVIFSYGPLSYPFLHRVSYCTLGRFVEQISVILII